MASMCKSARSQPVITEQMVFGLGIPLKSIDTATYQSYLVR